MKPPPVSYVLYPCIQLHDSTHCPIIQGARRVVQTMSRHESHSFGADGSEAILTAFAAKSYPRRMPGQEEATSLAPGLAWNGGMRNSPVIREKEAFTWLD